MPADGAKYKIVRQPLYEKALALSPHNPDPPTPDKLYKLVRVRETTGGTEPLHLMVAVREVQILTNGYVVRYTIRESGQTVILEDLYLPMLYRLPAFQPEG